MILHTWSKLASEAVDDGVEEVVDRGEHPRRGLEGALVFQEVGHFLVEGDAADTIALPANVAADFSVSTFSGSVDNAFGPPATRVGEHTPEKELEFSTGGGGASVSIHTLSGGVTLRKK